MQLLDAFAPMKFNSVKSSPIISRKTSLEGGKMSKFGIFSPAVYAAKLALGEARLNKVRVKRFSNSVEYIIYKSCNYCIPFAHLFSR